MHWTLADKIGELAHEENTNWNLMATTLIELGMPVFLKLRRNSRALARNLTRKRYTYQLRKPAADRIDVIAEKEASRIKLDSRISAAIPSSARRELELEAKRRGKKGTMSQVLREKAFGVKF
jgi:hypothetical protein